MEAVSIECYQCAGCGSASFGPRKVCPRCGGTRIEKKQAEGRGKLIDYTTVYYPPDDYKDICPYASVMVKLNNGCQLFGVVPGEVKDATLGSPVTLVKHDPATGRLIFRLG